MSDTIRLMTRNATAALPAGAAFCDLCHGLQKDARHLLWRNGKRVCPECSDVVPTTRGWLLNLLSRGPVRSTDLWRAAKRDGYSEQAVRRARSKLGARVLVTEDAGGWVWSLADTLPPDLQPSLPLFPCVDWLLARLSAGTVLATAVVQDACAAGFTIDDLAKARIALGITPAHDRGDWYWALPGTPDPADEPRRFPAPMATTVRALSWSA